MPKKISTPYVNYGTIFTSHNRSKRSQIKNYRSIFKKLMIKYKFQCVHCNCKENLTIDHIIPVSKGGKDDIENLQILCKSCNSKKDNINEL